MGELGSGFLSSLALGEAADDDSDAGQQQSDSGDDGGIEDLPADFVTGVEGEQTGNQHDALADQVADDNHEGSDGAQTCDSAQQVVLGSEDGSGEHAPHKYFPWLAWQAENDATVNVEDIVLGEIVVSDKEEADTSMMGTAPADPAFTVTLATEDGWKAGEKLVVTATVDVLKDGVDLSQILFNLYYDAADVEIVLPEELGAIITAGAESWKEDSLFTLSVDGDYGVIECAPATTVEADVLKKGTQLVMTFEFTVKADAEGLINFQLSNKGLTGYSWDIDAAEVAGAGSSLAVGNADELGDTGIYVIAALALVALIVKNAINAIKFFLPITFIFHLQIKYLP